MGKLHKIRRAIERDPQAWMVGRPVPVDDGRRWAVGASLTKKAVKPFKYIWYENRFHRNYVRKVLCDLGFMVH